MMSGTRKPKRLRQPFDRKGVVVDEPAPWSKKPPVAVKGPALRVAGSSSRQRAGEAVAELGGIGPEVLARGAGVTRHPHVVVAVSAAVGEEVEERLRPAHREARKLDERAIPERVEGRAAAGGPGVVFSAPKRM